MARHILESTLQKNMTRRVRAYTKLIFTCITSFNHHNKLLTKEAPEPQKSLARIQVSWCAGLFSNIL